jgi:hypothetical protein
MVLSCNHLDCSSATYIRKTIRTSLAAGKAEDAIVAGFVEQYGAKILPEPPRQGFSWMAWLMPFAALLLGGGAVSYVLWRWKKGPSAEELGENPSEQGTEPASPEVSPALVENTAPRLTGILRTSKPLPAGGESRTTNHLSPSSVLSGGASRTRGAARR